MIRIQRDLRPDACALFQSVYPAFDAPTICIRRVSVVGLRWAARLLYRKRYDEAAALARIYLDAGLQPFEPAQGSSGQWLLPVFVMDAAGAQLIVDGAHRAAAAASLGVESLYVWAWKIAGTYPPYPFETFDREQVEIREDIEHWRDRFEWLEGPPFVDFTRISRILAGESQ